MTFFALLEIFHIFVLYENLNRTFCSDADAHKHDKMKKVIIVIAAVFGFAVMASAQPKAIGGRLGYGLEAWKSMQDLIFLAASRASGLPEHITSHSPSLHGLLEAIGHGMPALVSLWVPPITMMTIISSSEL